MGRYLWELKKEVALCSLFLFSKPLAIIFFSAYNIYVEREKYYDIRRGAKRNWKIFKENQKY